MAGTTEGGKKAAETRGHENLSAAGKKGGEASHGGHQNDHRQSEIHGSSGHSSNQHRHRDRDDE